MTNPMIRVFWFLADASEGDGKRSYNMTLSLSNSTADEQSEAIM